MPGLAGARAYGGGVMDYDVEQHIIVGKSLLVIK